MQDDRKTQLAKIILDFSDRLARMSTCSRGQHACIITDARLNIISCGYNGSAPGLSNGCKRPDVSGNCGCIHAEANAICGLSGRVGHFAFVTGGPCENCAQMFVRVGIRCVIYGLSTRSFQNGGKIVLEDAGITTSGFVDPVILFDDDGDKFPAHWPSRFLGL